MRNKSLDAVKAIAACLVVCIHVSFPGQAGQIVKVFARCAVPFFFMVSGYFCYYENGNAAVKIPLKIIHILKLLIVSVLFYFIWEYLMEIFFERDAVSWIKGLADIDHVREFVIYNSTSPVRAHLWFLPALIYCYVLDFFIEKCKLKKVAYCCVPALMLVLLWRAEFCRFFGGFYHTMEYRNFLFTGMSFYLTGQMLHKNQDKIEQTLSEKSNRILIAGAAVGIGVSVLEYCLQGAREIYTGNCITVICLFIWLILYGSEKEFPQVLAEAGRKYAFPIYLLHPAIVDILKKFSDAAGISGNMNWLWVRPLLAYVITLLMTCCIFTLNIHIRGCSQNKKCGIVISKSYDKESKKNHKKIR